MIDGQYRLDRNLFDNVMQNLDSMLSWYGAIGCEYFELPHIEMKNWKQLYSSGILKLVE
jgi:hypothetical protein